jgi:hypothetical protein
MPNPIIMSADQVRIACQADSFLKHLAGECFGDDGYPEEAFEVCVRPEGGDLRRHPRTASNFRPG